VTEQPALRGYVKTRRDRYGFVRADGASGGHEYFFHEDDQADDFDLVPGDRVRFEVVDPQPARGPRAKNVQLEASR